MGNSHYFSSLERKFITLVDLRGKAMGRIFSVGTEFFEKYVPQLVMGNSHYFSSLKRKFINLVDLRGKAMGRIFLSRDGFFEKYVPQLEKYVPPYLGSSIFKKIRPTTLLVEYVYLG